MKRQPHAKPYVKPYVMTPAVYEKVRDYAARNGLPAPRPPSTETAADSVRRKLSVLSLTDVDSRVLSIADKLMEKELARQPRMSADEAGHHLRDYLSAAAEVVREWQDQESRYSPFAG